MSIVNYPSDKICSDMCSCGHHVSRHHEKGSASYCEDCSRIYLGTFAHHFYPVDIDEEEEIEEPNTGRYILNEGEKLEKIIKWNYQELEIIDEFWEMKIQKKDLIKFLKESNFLNQIGYKLERI